MITRLRSSLNHYGGPVCVIGRLRNDLKEQRLGDVMGAGAGYEISARAKDFERPEIDFLIAALCCRDAFAVFGESRGVEDYHIEAAIFLIVLLEHVERIGFAKRNMFDAVEFLISPSGDDGGGR